MSKHTLESQIPEGVPVYSRMEHGQPDPEESKHLMQIECTAILFDLDGVLIDSTASITRHWQQWAQRHNLDLTEIMKVAAWQKNYRNHEARRSSLVS